MLRLLHADLQRQEGVRLLFVEPDRQQVPAGLEPRADGRRVPGQFLPAAGTHDQHLVGRQVSALVRSQGDAGLFEIALAGRIADVEGLAPWRRFPGGRVVEDVPGQRLGRRVGLGAPGHVHLAEQHHALAFAVLHQRAVLEAEAAVEDRQEIAAGGLLDQHGGHVAAVAAAPHARHLDVAPLDRRGAAVAGAEFVLQARRQDRRLAAPVAQVLRAEPGQKRMVGHALERPAAGRTPCTRKPNRFSSTSEVCSNTITFSPSRTRVMSGAGPSTVRAALPTIRMSYADRSALASTGWHWIPMAFKQSAGLALRDRRGRSSRLVSGMEACGRT